MNPVLSLAGLGRRFGALTAVAGVDLQLVEGGRHGLVGGNGAGKTTLIDLITGLLRPTAGTIRFAGRDITFLPPARRSRLGIARTFQTPAVCDSLTVLDNMVLGAWHHQGTAAGRRWWPARHRRLAARSHRLVDQLGLAHLAGHRAGALSHGQRRLVEIGAVLAACPRLLLLDEPAAGLSDDDLPLLTGALELLPADVAVLIVEHHLDLVTTLADTLTVMHHGRIITTGPPAHVLADPAVAQVYLLGTPDVAR